MSAHGLPSHFTVREVATILQLSPQRILRWIAEGRLQVDRGAVKYQILRDSLIRFVAELPAW